MPFVRKHRGGKLIFRLVLAVLLISELSGCVALLATGAAGGYVVSRDRRGAAAVIEDHTLASQAERRIESLKGLDDETHINVSSYNLVLLVTGEAANEEDRQRVLEAVGSVPKVRHIYNEIRVGPASRVANRAADTAITTQVKSSLLGLTGIDLTRVKVVTERGVVYLMGLVTQKEGAAAAARARTVGGVRKVVKLFEYPEYPAGGGLDAAPAAPPAAPPASSTENRAVL
jgi:osmotically-inducible protein OsmY